VKGMVIYYSFSGSTAMFAKRLAAEKGWTVKQVTEKKKRTVFGTFIKGTKEARRRREAEIARFKPDWSGIQAVAVACPIWGGYPAPAFNSIIKLVPKKLPIELYFVSGSGSSAASRAETEQLLKDEGYNIVGYTDVMTKSIAPAPTAKQKVEEAKEEIKEAVAELKEEAAEAVSEIKEEIAEAVEELKDND